MNILIANDDGIGAKGIKELARALSQIANIYVCAPHTQRSACGHGITVGQPIMMKEVEFPNARRAWEITGTPADCVKLGLKVLSAGVKIHMVCSGITREIREPTPVFGTFRAIEVVSAACQPLRFL
jgi:5'-nucleotidase